MIRVVIVEDSVVTQQLLAHILASDRDIEVVGIANNGEEACGMVERIHPDIVIMDIFMPKLNGYDATRKIMETYPVPIVLMSAILDTKEAAATFRTLEAGALTIIEKPCGPGHLDYQRMAADFIRMIKLMAEVKVVKRWPKDRYGIKQPSKVKDQSTFDPGDGSVPTSGPVSGSGQMPTLPATSVNLIAIGASTGGPVVLQTILSGLKESLLVPVLIVQHIFQGFLEGLVEWLTQTTALPIRISSQGEHIEPGHIYFAPSNFHMGIANGERIMLSTDEPENGLRPSVSYLFRSVRQFYGKTAAGILLTGMGSDGAVELKAMRESGAITIVQDEASSVVYGMPGAAMKLGAAQYSLAPKEISAILNEMIKRGQG